eukprot:2220716-Alexandrium_andersonii.AAC.1
MNHGRVHRSSPLAAQPHAWGRARGGGWIALEFAHAACCVERSMLRGRAQTGSEHVERAC